MRRRRREDRGAEGVEGVGCGVSPSPPGEEAGEGLCPLPRNIFLILALNMVSSGAFWMVFLTVQLPVLHAKPLYAYKSRDGE